jgi:hypothetical protein
MTTRAHPPIAYARTHAASTLNGNLPTGSVGSCTECPRWHPFIGHVTGSYGNRRAAAIIEGRATLGVSR